MGTANYLKARLTKLTLIAVALMLVLATFISTVHASAENWNWQDATDPTWTDTVNSTGPMVWGEIYDTAVYGGGIWTGGRDAENHATLWRYDETTGAWTNEMPAGLASEEHRSVTALAVYANKLYLSTDNSSNGLESQMWVKNNTGAAWEKVASYDALNLGQTYSMTTYADDLCLSGSDTVFRVWCFDGTSWTNTNITGAFSESWKSSKLAVVGSKLYVDAMTIGGYFGIWGFNGSSWDRVETPFTDEEEDTEIFETDHYVRGVGSFDGKLIAVSIDDDNEKSYAWQYSGSSWTQLGQANYDGDNDAGYDHADIGTYNGKLYIGAGGYGESARVFEYDSNANEFHQVNNDYFGLSPENNQFIPNYVSNMVYSNGVLFVTTSGSGEGDYFPQLWRSQPLGSSNGHNGETSELPNGGDLNNDGTVDSAQNHVSSFKNPISDKYVVLEVSDECSISEAGMKRIGELSGRDSGYEYVNGLMDFDVNCGDPGFTTTVSQYYYDVPKNGLVLRKYMPTTNAYFTINGAQTESLTIDGHNITKATYQVTDGGELDVDGEANGVIVDPAGLASSSVGVPRTGLGGKQAN